MYADDFKINSRIVRIGSDGSLEKDFHRDRAAVRDTAEGAFVIFHPGKVLVKNRIEPIACIPRCLDPTRVDSMKRPRVIREKCAAKME